MGNDQSTDYSIPCRLLQQQTAKRKKATDRKLIVQDHDRFGRTPVAPMAKGQDKTAKSGHHQ